MLDFFSLPLLAVHAAAHGASCLEHGGYCMDEWQMDLLFLGSILLWIAILGLFFAAVNLFSTRRNLRYLRFFQQQEYDSPRYLKWILERRAFDRRGSVVLLTAALFSWLCQRNSDALGGDLSLLFIEILIPSFTALILLLIRSLEENPVKLGKIPLRMTERATRIYEISLVLSALAIIAVLALLILGFNEISKPFLAPAWLFYLALIPIIQLTPLWLVLANWLLKPRERRIQEHFLDEAKSTLQRIDPFIIGITGSYGKTSTKSILGEMLNIALGPTFWSPGSLNTLMGLTREIRERLSPGYRYAVMEMGAYKIGSIKKLCGLCPPKAGIITAVGIMHFERYQSEENVFRAKSELAKEIPLDGILVCNGDNAGARRIAEENPKAVTLLYGLDPSKGRLDCWMSDIEINENGSHFVVHWKDKAYRGFTQLLGKPALSNILGAFTMCLTLGGNAELAVAAVRNIEPVENRLSLTKTGGTTWLKDAYNSNPEGFAAALEVLAALPGSRKILMTPGIIELGTKQYEENSIAGKKAAAVCHLALIVGETNKAAIDEGLRSGGFATDKILHMPTREEAFAYLSEHAKQGDVVLIENDLCDLYEMNAKF